MRLILIKNLFRRNGSIQNARFRRRVNPKASISVYKQVAFVPNAIAVFFLRLQINIRCARVCPLPDLRRRPADTRQVLFHFFGHFHKAGACRVIYNNRRIVRQCKISFIAVPLLDGRKYFRRRVRIFYLREKFRKLRGICGNSYRKALLCRVCGIPFCGRL